MAQSTILQPLVGGRWSQSWQSGSARPTGDQRPTTCHRRLRATSSRPFAYALGERTQTIPIDLETVAENRLVAEALAGSQSAFERIVRRYQRPVISLILRVLGSRGDRAFAEDLAQEAFVKAYLKLSAFDSQRRLSSWLFRIAHNTAVDALRRSRHPTIADSGSRESALSPEDTAASPQPDPVETEALGRALETAMAELRPEHRAAMTLRYEEGLPFEEIAHVLGVTESTARSYVHRARKQLAAHLTEAGWHA